MFINNTSAENRKGVLFFLFVVYQAIDDLFSNEKMWDKSLKYISIIIIPCLLVVVSGVESEIIFFLYRFGFLFFYAYLCVSYMFNLNLSNYLSTMEKKYFAPSELIINEDGSIFHLHLKPENLADKVILVGDPGRVALVASHFEDIECEVSNREFRAITGTFQGKRITVLSTGIGCDNIDIVVNELDALANIDFKTRTENETLRQLTLVRIGTCGGLQPYTPVGTYIASVKSIGFDGLLNFYAGRNQACDLDFEEQFKKQVEWDSQLGNPYVACADKELLDSIAADDMVRGVTIACGGFFGPQGRELRLPLQDPKLNEKIEKFSYNDMQVTNFEMESSALAGLATLMGHKAVTVCMVIANRLAKEANSSYKNTIDGLIEKVLERI